MFHQLFTLQFYTKVHVFYALNNFMQTTVCIQRRTSYSSRWIDESYPHRKGKCSNRILLKTLRLSSIYDPSLEFTTIVYGKQIPVKREIYAMVTSFSVHFFWFKQFILGIGIEPLVVHNTNRQFGNALCIYIRSSMKPITDWIAETISVLIFYYEADGHMYR